MDRIKISCNYTGCIISWLTYNKSSSGASFFISLRLQNQRDISCFVKVRCSWAQVLDSNLGVCPLRGGLLLQPKPGLLSKPKPLDCFP